MRRTSAFVIAFLGVSFILSGVAGAHAAYKSSDPGDRSSVSSAPSRVTAEFTEPLANGSFLQVTDPCGERVDRGDVSIVGYEMSVSMAGSRAGRYTVFYKALSQLDPHVVEGTFVFTATSGAACESEQDPGSSGGTSEPAAAPGDDGIATSSDAQGGGSVDLAQGPSSEEEGSGSGSDARADRAGSRSSRPPGRAPTAARVPNLAGSPDEDAGERRSVYDGIPTGTFVISLFLCALIGAAGGKIYAGIMGPRA